MLVELNLIQMVQKIFLSVDLQCITCMRFFKDSSTGRHIVMRFESDFTIDSTQHYRMLVCRFAVIKKRIFQSAESRKGQ